MKRLIVYCLLIGAVSVLVTGSFFIRINIFNKKIRDLSALHYSIKSKEYNDYIIVGGSNAEGGLSPAIIDSITGKKTYNLSIKGIGIIEESMMVKKYLQVHPKPKAVFILLDYETLNTEKNPHNLTDYFSYLSDTFIYAQLSPYRSVYKNKMEQYYMQFQKILATGDEDKNDIFKLNNIIDSLNIQKSERGFFPYDFKWLWDADEDLTVKKDIKFTEEGFGLLTNLANECRDDSVQLVIMISPTYFEGKKSYSNLDEFESVIEKSAIKMNILLWKHDRLAICQSKENFYNMYHLNLKGANKFSIQVASDILQQIH